MRVPCMAEGTRCKAKACWGRRNILLFSDGCLNMCSDSTNITNKGLKQDTFMFQLVIGSVDIVIYQ